MAEIRGIVRICGQDLPGHRPIRIALTKIKGVGFSYAHAVTVKFLELTGLPWNTKLGEINEEQERLLEDIIINPQKYGIPSWLYNTRKDYYTGQDLHLVESDLEAKEREVLKRLAGIKCWRGLRRMWGLKVRGQRTRTHGRKNKQRMTRKKRR